MSGNIWYFHSFWKASGQFSVCPETFHTSTASTNFPLNMEASDKFSTTKKSIYIKEINTSIIKLNKYFFVWNMFEYFIIFVNLRYNKNYGLLKSNATLLPRFFSLWEGVWQMLTLADKGGRGVMANADLADKGKRGLWQMITALTKMFLKGQKYTLVFKLILKYCKLLYILSICCCHLGRGG